MSEQAKPEVRPTLETLDNDAGLRVDLQMKFGRYSHAQKKVQEARLELREAKRELAALMPTNAEFILKSNYEHYLVTTDYQGRFESKKLPQFGF